MYKIRLYLVAAGLSLPCAQVLLQIKWTEEQGVPLKCWEETSQAA